MTTISYPVTGTDYRYWVYETDSQGYEVPEIQNEVHKFVSPTLVSLVSDSSNPVTDVFIVIHGWNTVQRGNEEIDFFDLFFDSFMKDYVNFPPQSGNFNPLLIGVHWPSAPGSGRANERIDDESTFDDNVARIERLARGLRKTDPPAAECIEKIVQQISAAASGSAPGLSEPALEANVNKVEHLLDSPAKEAVTDKDTVGNIIAENPEKANVPVISTSSEGGMHAFSKKIFTDFLRPLEDKIFGQFVRRSQAVGENGVHNLLALLQEYAPSTTRFHLICHSLGAAALCRALVGGEKSEHLLRKKVHSAAIIQGAIGSHSLSKGEVFERITQEFHPVAGPIVVTTSQTDRALASYRFFHDQPLGLHGAVDVHPMPSSVKHLGDVSVDYAFQPGHIFNIVADKYVDEGDMVGGSHGDIFGPEIMRMLRQAIDCRVEDKEYMLPTSLSKEYFSERVGHNVADTGIAESHTHSQHEESKEGQSQRVGEAQGERLQAEQSQAEQLQTGQSNVEKPKTEQSQGGCTLS